MTHQLTIERFEFRMVLFHNAEYVSRFSIEPATANSNNRIPLLPQWIAPAVRRFSANNNNNNKKH